MFESQHSRLFLFIGGLSAIFSSLCCLGPLLLLALGFSGAWLANLTALEPYRPVFILISFIALFFAWRRIFRTQSSCQPGEPCVSASDHRRRAVIFYGVLVLVLFALVFPYLLPLFYYDGMDAAGTTPRTEEVEQCMEQLPRLFL